MWVVAVKRERGLAGRAVFSGTYVHGSVGVEWKITAKGNGKGKGLSSHYRGSRWVLARIGPGGAWLRSWNEGKGHRELIDAANRPDCEESSSKSSIKVPVEKGFQFVKKEVAALTHLVSIRPIETGQISTRRAHTPRGD